MFHVEQTEHTRYQDLFYNLVGVEKQVLMLMLKQALDQEQNDNETKRILAKEHVDAKTDMNRWALRLEKNKGSHRRAIVK